MGGDISGVLRGGLRGEGLGEGCGVKSCLKGMGSLLRGIEEWEEVEGGLFDL